MNQTISLDADMVDLLEAHSAMSGLSVSDLISRLLSAHLPALHQRYDLLMADLAWLRRWHSDHAKVVRYRRCRVLIAGSDTQFQRESEYAYWAGRRPAWKLVGSLSLTIPSPISLISNVTRHAMRTGAQETRKDFSARMMNPSPAPGSMSRSTMKERLCTA